MPPSSLPSSLSYASTHPYPYHYRLLLCYEPSPWEHLHTTHMATNAASAALSVSGICVLKKVVAMTKRRVIIVKWFMIGMM
jgi:hypothetical protein